MEWIGWPDWIGPGDCGGFVAVPSTNNREHPQEPVPEPEAKPLPEQEIVADDGR